MLSGHGRDCPEYDRLSEMAVVVIEQQKAMLQMVGAVTGKNMAPAAAAPISTMF